MKVTTKIKFATLVMATALFCSNAAAETLTPTPKAYSTINSESIVLGDVFENVGDKADFFLAPAPAIGKTRIIAFNDLVRISDTLNLGWEPENQGQQTIIRRTGSNIDAKDVEAAIQEKLRAAITKKDFEVTLTNKNLKFDAANKGNKQLVVTDVDFDAAKMVVNAKVALAADPENAKEIKAFVSYIHEVPVLTENKRKGEVISEGDLQYIKMKSADITANMVVNAEELIGKTPRNTITAMAPVYAADLKLPNLIKKGDVVVMKFNSNLISLTTQGYAVQDGKQGDLIRVENVTSKQVVTAVVTGEREVSITAPSVSTTM